MQTSEAFAFWKGGATERVRDDFLMQRIKKSSRTSAVRDDVCVRNTIDEPSFFKLAMLGCI